MVLTLSIGALLIFIISTAIPVYGHHRKQWKGLALGCLLQPVACAIGILLLSLCIAGIEEIMKYQEHKAVMVTIKTTEAGTYGTDSLTWYLKPDEECLVEYKLLIKDKYETPDSIQEAEKTDRFDVIRLDSLTNAVCVDDRLIVRFDLKNQRVTATDYDEPAEVVGVDWEKVKAYFP
jgi:hypothetical protein